MNHRNVLLGELTRKELAEAVSNDMVTGAIVPTGATEQHQDHLAMIHDTASVGEIACRAASRFYPRLLVTPTVPVSVSEHHMVRGGALTVRPDIYLEYVIDVCDSLKRLGFSRVMVLNGHGGNKWENLQKKYPRGLQKLESMGVRYVTYWQTCSPEFYQQHLELETSAGHAGEFETSFAMALFPQRIRTDQVNYENALKASISKGGHILEAVVNGVCGELEIMLTNQV